MPRLSLLDICLLTSARGIGPGSVVRPRLRKPAEISAISARCPHCGDLNVFPHFDQILAYVCQHCGEGVVASPPVQ